MTPKQRGKYVALIGLRSEKPVHFAVRLPDDPVRLGIGLVQRQPQLREGGRPGIVALDRNGRVVVIEVKREFDRGQLAQCLEYAAWARRTNLDELAQMYRHGAQRFFTDWQEFTESEVPVTVNPSPRLVLLAGSFHGRTESAVEFLIENRLPVKVVAVTVYEDQQGRRFVDIEAEHEPEFATTEQVDVADHTKIDGRRVRLSDLLEARLLEPGDSLYWNRPQLGQRYEATVTEIGAILLGDGRAVSSPSRAAIIAADTPAADGWYTWRLERLAGKSLDHSVANLRLIAGRRSRLSVSAERRVAMEVARARVARCTSAPPG